MQGRALPPAFSTENIEKKLCWIGELYINSNFIDEKQKICEILEF